ncbi:hypothetical protein GF386_01795 [Candidatus Pacearchaeota archaeon]|nr:hypothetical protein [Candidatus Pacearchaeota archaeon]MBD3282912.1 hypothetical protein [Candidatus Pacearchaeota archaeon]
MDKRISIVLSGLILTTIIMIAVFLVVPVSSSDSYNSENYQEFEELTEKDIVISYNYKNDFNCYKPLKQYKGVPCIENPEQYKESCETRNPDRCNGDVGNNCYKPFVQDKKTPCVGDLSQYKESCETRNPDRCGLKIIEIAY